MASNPSQRGPEVQKIILTIFSLNKQSGFHTGYSAGGGRLLGMNGYL